MANEATIRASLSIQIGKLDYRSSPTVHKATVTGTDGPTPGAITVAVAPGTNVSLAELTTPGLCWIQNLDSTNYVTGGTYDPESNLFYPLFELLAGEFYVFRLARDLGEEYATGTGTVGPNTNTLRLIADTAACNVIVAAFEK